VKDKPAEFLLISGDDLLTPSMMAIGAVGVISVLANAFPALFKEMVHAALDNRFAKSSAAAFKMLEINPLMYAESNPVGVKQVLKELGICQNFVRLPLVPASEALTQKISKALSAM
jgi:4-hydroxy-tetrahydrodipicolinate synthase